MNTAAMAANAAAASANAAAVSNLCGTEVSGLSVLIAIAAIVLFFAVGCWWFSREFK